MAKPGALKLSESGRYYFELALDIMVGNQIKKDGAFHIIMLWYSRHLTVLVHVQPSLERAAYVHCQKPYGVKESRFRHYKLLVTLTDVLISKVPVLWEVRYSS